MESDETALYIGEENHEILKQRREESIIASKEKSDDVTDTFRKWKTIYDGIVLISFARST